MTPKNNDDDIIKTFQAEWYNQRKVFDDETMSLKEGIKIRRDQLRDALNNLLNYKMNDDLQQNINDYISELKKLKIRADIAKNKLHEYLNTAFSAKDRDVIILKIDPFNVYRTPSYKPLSKVMYQLVT